MATTDPAAVLTGHGLSDEQIASYKSEGYVWFALNDMTERNGCLRIVPRSHLEGTYESTESGDGDGHRRMKTDPSDSVPMIMQPGDCVAFSRLTVHGSGPNDTDPAARGLRGAVSS